MTLLNIFSNHTDLAAVRFKATRILLQYCEAFICVLRNTKKKYISLTLTRKTNYTGWLNVGQTLDSTNQTDNESTTSSLKYFCFLAV